MRNLNDMICIRMLKTCAETICENSAQNEKKSM